jgi:hypothetical protein
MRYEFRPLTWADKETDPRQSSGLFRASWNDTLALLADELRHLEAAKPVVFQVDVAETDVRLDGMLRAHARPDHPGVAISFGSKFGPLRYATDTYEQRYKGAMPGWQANIRAIALALQALRAVDRYGVSRRGEQYTGWKALPAGSRPHFATADEAERWMGQRMRELGLPVATNLPQMYRQLARRMHPDADGDPAEWDKLDQARNLLVTAGML